MSDHFGDLDAAQTIVAGLGAKWRGSYGLCKCPCHDDRHASLTVRNGRVAPLVSCKAGCSWKDIVAELRRRRLWPDRPASERRPYPQHRARPRPPGPVKLDAEGEASAAEVRGAIERLTTAAGGTVVETYLRNRAITIPIPADIHFIPAAGMVAILRQLDGVITACQRTTLKADGSDRQRHPYAKLTYGVMGSGVVRLGMPDDVLGLAGGVETGLSAMQLSGIPVWVTLGEFRFTSVAIPPRVRRLIIFADNDKPGRQAADAARRLYLGSGVKVEIHLPLEGFKDFNAQHQAKMVSV